MDYVQNKSSSTIYMYQDLVAEQEEDAGSKPRIVASEVLPPENNLGRSVRQDFELWLRTLLQWDPKARGRRSPDGGVSLFDDLAKILAKRRVSVLIMDRAVPDLDYAVTKSTTGAEVVAWIERDCGVAKHTQLLLTAEGMQVTASAAVVASSPSGQPVQELFVFQYPTSATETQGRPSHMAVDVPLSLQPFLRNPRREVGHRLRRQVCAHTYFMLAREQRACEAVTRGLEALASFVDNRLRELNRGAQILTKLADATLARFEFFRESLQHDLDKYVAQAQKEDRITSNQMYESWVISEKAMQTKFAELKLRLAATEQKVKAVIARAGEVLAEPLLADEGGSDLSDLVAKGLALVEDSRLIPVTGRSERESLMDTAQLAVKALKRRDKALRSHLEARNRLLAVYDDLISADLAEAVSAVEAFAAAVSRAQRRRQSDVWKLLAAAVQKPRGDIQTTTTSTSTAEETQLLLDENQALREQLKELNLCTGEALNRL